MTTLAGILGMPLPAGPTGAAGQGGGAALPPGVFEALVAESVAADELAEPAAFPGSTGETVNRNLPAIMAWDGAGEVAIGIAGTQAAETPSGATPSGAVPSGAMLRGHLTRVSSQLGTVAQEPDALGASEDEEDEVAAEWMSYATSAVSGEPSSEMRWREVPDASAGLAGSGEDIRGAGGEAHDAAMVVTTQAEQAFPSGSDRAYDAPEPRAGERENPIEAAEPPHAVPPDTGGVERAMRDGGGKPPVTPAPVHGSAPQTASPRTASDQMAPRQDEVPSEPGGRPHAVRASQTAVHAGVPVELAAVQDASAQAVGQTASPTPSSARHGWQDGAPPLAETAAVRADVPVQEPPDAGEPVEGMLDGPSESQGASREFSNEGSAAGGEGKQAGTDRSHPGLTAATTPSPVTPGTTAPADLPPPAPAEVAPLAEEVGEGVNHQIVQSLRAQLRGGIGEAVVRLKPEHLGEVTINVRIERGAVEATVTAALPAVREWLEAQEPVVRQHLAEQGLSLTRLRVEPDGSHPGGGHAGRQEQGQAQRRRLRSHTEPSGRFDVVV